jgi:hypothetical protein
MSDPPAQRSNGAGRCTALLGDRRTGPKAVPPIVVVDCVAVLPKPRARLMLLPPLVITRPRRRRLDRE